MAGLPILDEKTVEELLKWDEVVPVVRQALIAVSLSRLKDEDKGSEYKELKMTNPKRIFAEFGSDHKKFMLCMPGYVEGFDLGKLGDKNKKESALSCKILNIFDDNGSKVPPLPTISGYLFMFDDTNGTLKAVRFFLFFMNLHFDLITMFQLMGAERITEWRTAAATLIATQLLWDRAAPSSSGGKRILAIFGAGAQGRIHAIALQQQFHFDEVRIDRSKKI